MRTCLILTVLLGWLSACAESSREVPAEVRDRYSALADECLDQVSATNSAERKRIEHFFAHNSTEIATAVTTALRSDASFMIKKAGTSLAVTRSSEYYRVSVSDKSFSYMETFPTFKSFSPEPRKGRSAELRDHYKMLIVGNGMFYLPDSMPERQCAVEMGTISVPIRIPSSKGNEFHYGLTGEFKGKMLPQIDLVEETICTASDCDSIDNDKKRLEDMWVAYRMTGEAVWYGFLLPPEFVQALLNSEKEEEDHRPHFAP